MSFFDDIGGALFGGSDPDGQRRQRRYNIRVQKDLESLLEDARSDALAFQPGIDAARNSGYQGGMDVLAGVLPEQMAAQANGNYFAQDALLSGLTQQNNAILGLPTDMSGLQARKFNPYNRLPENVTNPQLPQAILAGNSPSGLSGNEAQDFAGSFTPGVTTNSEIAARAREAELISQGDYNWMNNFFGAAGNGSKTGWGSAGSAAPLLANLDRNAAGDSPLNGQNRQRLEQLYMLMYPGGTA